MNILKTTQQRKARINVEGMLSFNGVDQYGDAGVNENVISVINYNKAFSISCFVSVNNNANTQWLFNSVRFNNSAHSSGGTNMNNGFALWVDTSTNLNFELRRRTSLATPPAGFLRDIVSTPMKYSVLYHVAIVSNGTILFLYINTKLVAQINISITADIYSGGDIPNLFFSGYKVINTGAHLSHLNGSISHLTFFNRTLTQTEIKEIHGLGGWFQSDAIKSACVAHYPCTHREGAKLYDVVEQYNTFKTLLNNPGDYGTQNDGSGDWIKSDGSALNVLATYVTIGNSSTQSKRIYIPENGLYKYSFSYVIRTARATGIFEVYQNNILIAASDEFGNISNGNLSNSGTFEFSVGGTFEIRYRQTDQGVGSSSDLFNDNLSNTEKLSSYHADLINYDPAEHTGAVQIAWKDFYTKNQLALNGVHFASSGSAWYGTNISNTPLLNSSYSTYLEIVLSTKNTYPNDNYSFRFGFDTVLQFRLRGNLVAQRINLQWLNNVVKGSPITPVLDLDILHKIVITYDIDSKEMICYCKNSKVILSNIPELTENNGSYGVNDTSYNITSYILFRNIWFNRVLTESEVKSLQSGKDNESAFMDYAFTEQNGIVNRIDGNWPLSYSGGQTNKIEKKSLLPPIEKALQITGNQYASISSIAPTRTNGYTWLISFALDSNRDFSDDGLFRHLGNGNYAIILRKGSVNYVAFPADATASNTTLPDLDYSKPHQLIIEAYAESGYSVFLDGVFIGQKTSTAPDMSTLTGDFLIGSYLSSGAGINGTIMQFGFATGILTQKQKIELWNNSLLANPSKDWTNVNWLVYPEFNNIGAGALSNYGNTGGEATLYNYTADQLNPAHTDYALTDINALR